VSKFDKKEKGKRGEISLFSTADGDACGWRRTEPSRRAWRRPSRPVAVTGQPPACPAAAAAPASWRLPFTTRRVRVRGIGKGVARPVTPPRRKSPPTCALRSINRPPLAPPPRCNFSRLVLRV